MVEDNNQLGEEPEGVSIIRINKGKQQRVLEMATTYANAVLLLFQSDSFIRHGSKARRKAARRQQSTRIGLDAY